MADNLTLGQHAAAGNEQATIPTTSHNPPNMHCDLNLEGQKPHRRNKYHKKKNNNKAAYHDRQGPNDDHHETLDNSLQSVRPESNPGKAIRNDNETDNSPASEIGNAEKPLGSQSGSVANTDIHATSYGNSVYLKRGSRSRGRGGNRGSVGSFYHNKRANRDSARPESPGDTSYRSYTRLPVQDVRLDENPSIPRRVFEKTGRSFNKPQDIRFETNPNLERKIFNGAENKAAKLPTQLDVLFKEDIADSQSPRAEVDPINATDTITRQEECLIADSGSALGLALSTRVTPTGTHTRLQVKGMTPSVKQEEAMPETMNKGFASTTTPKDGITHPEFPIDHGGDYIVNVQLFARGDQETAVSFSVNDGILKRHSPWFKRVLGDECNIGFSVTESPTLVSIMLQYMHLGTIDACCPELPETREKCRDVKNNQYNGDILSEQRQYYRRLGYGEGLSNRLGLLLHMAEKYEMPDFARLIAECARHNRDSLLSQIQALKYNLNNVKDIVTHLEGDLKTVRMHMQNINFRDYEGLPQNRPKTTLGENLASERYRDTDKELARASGVLEISQNITPCSENLASSGNTSPAVELQVGWPLVEKISNTGATESPNGSSILPSRLGTDTQIDNLADEHVPDRNDENSEEGKPRKPADAGTKPSVSNDNKVVLDDKPNSDHPGSFGDPVKAAYGAPNGARAMEQINDSEPTNAITKSPNSQDEVHLAQNLNTGEEMHSAQNTTLGQESRDLALVVKEKDEEAGVNVQPEENW